MSRTEPPYLAVLRPLARLLVPFALCFMLNGFLGYLFFARMLARGAYAEYMHLALAFAFPLLGLLFSRRDIDLTRPFL